MAFEARYPGVCYNCEDDFRAGDAVTYNELNELAHTECPTPPRARPICQQCFIEQPCFCE